MADYANGGLLAQAAPNKDDLAKAVNANADFYATPFQFDGNASGGVLNQYAMGQLSNRVAGGEDYNTTAMKLLGDGIGSGTNPMIYEQGSPPRDAVFYDIATQTPTTKAFGSGSSYLGTSTPVASTPTTGMAGGTSTGRTTSSYTSSTSPSGAALSSVTPDQTVEGRIGSLMSTDASGNYTNQVVRQAAERATQAFAGRGLLNSSMAVQAAQEAAMSKAIEIASPDAKTYYDQSRANQDATNQFSLNDKQYNQSLEKSKLDADLTIQRMRTEFDLNGTSTDKANVNALKTNYMSSVQQATVNYTNRVNQINASQMSPEDKNAAALAAAQDRDGELTFINRMYTSMPGWSAQWGSVAVPTQGVDLGTINNITTLSNIADDPAQPQAVRDAARARIATINAQPKAAQPSQDSAKPTDRP